MSSIEHNRRATDNGVEKSQDEEIYGTAQRALRIEDFRFRSTDTSQFIQSVNGRIMRSLAGVQKLHLARVELDVELLERDLNNLFHLAFTNYCTWIFDSTGKRWDQHLQTIEHQVKGPATLDFRLKPCFMTVVECSYEDKKLLFCPADHRFLLHQRDWVPPGQLEIVKKLVEALTNVQDLNGFLEQLFRTKNGSRELTDGVTRRKTSRELPSRQAPKARRKDDYLEFHLIKNPRFLEAVNEAFEKSKKSSLNEAIRSDFETNLLVEFNGNEYRVNIKNLLNRVSYRILGKQGKLREARAYICQVLDQARKSPE